MDLFMNTLQINIFTIIFYCSNINEENEKISLRNENNIFEKIFDRRKKNSELDYLDRMLSMYDDFDNGSIFDDDNLIEINSNSDLKSNTDNTINVKDDFDNIKNLKNKIKGNKRSQLKQNNHKYSKTESINAKKKLILLKQAIDVEKQKNTLQKQMFETFVVKNSKIFEINSEDNNNNTNTKNLNINTNFIYAQNFTKTKRIESTSTSTTAEILNNPSSSISISTFKSENNVTNSSKIMWQDDMPNKNLKRRSDYDFIKYYIVFLLEKQKIFQKHCKNTQMINNTSYKNIINGLTEFIDSKIFYIKTLEDAQIFHHEENTLCLADFPYNNMNRNTFENIFNPYHISLSMYITKFIYYNELKKDLDKKINREENLDEIYNKEIIINIIEFHASDMVHKNIFLSLFENLDEMKFQKSGLFQLDKNRLKLLLTYYYNFFNIQKVQFELKLLYSRRNKVFIVMFLVYSLQKFIENNTCEINFIINCNDISTLAIFVNKLNIREIISCNDVENVIKIVKEKTLKRNYASNKHKKYKKILDDYKFINVEIKDLLLNLFKEICENVIKARKCFFGKETEQFLRKKCRYSIIALLNSIGYKLLNKEEKETVNNLEKTQSFTYFQILQKKTIRNTNVEIKMLALYCKDFIILETLCLAEFLINRIIRNVEILAEKLLREYENLELTSKNTNQSFFHFKSQKNIENMILKLDLYFFTVMVLQNFLKTNAFNIL